MSLAALVLAVAALLGRGTPPPTVVSAIAHGCQSEAEGHPVDAAACVALVTTYAAHESSFRVGAYGDGGKSYGLLQEPAELARRLDTRGQVAWWLATLRASSLASVDSSPSRAARRARLAARLLERVTLGVVERQP
jgi:hypothetical protein